MTSKKIIVGNWKMNPLTQKDALNIFANIRAVAGVAKKVTTVVCPPVIFLSDLLKSGKGSKVGVGAQDACAETSGAYTGEVSVAMVAQAGAGYVIVGHSERRAAGDTNEMVNKKVRSALKAGLKVILCVGEHEKDEHGHYLSFIKDQIVSALFGVPKTQFANILIAYEPIWAIGKEATGVETPEGFLHNMLFVRKVLDGVGGNKIAHSTPVLYGGSVDKKNAVAFLVEGKADGLLVGRASLEPTRFAEIIKLADKNA